MAISHMEQSSIVPLNCPEFHSLYSVGDHLACHSQKSGIWQTLLLLVALDWSWKYHKMDFEVLYTDK